MAGIKHSVVTSKANNPAYDVSSSAWNAEHTIDDASIVEAKLLLQDNTTGDATASTHGLCPKMDGDGNHYLDGAGGWTAPSVASVADTEVTFTDNTTGNASTSKHGYLKKLSNVATEFLNGEGNFAAVSVASVNDDDVVFADNAVGDASTSKHGYLKKLNGSTTQFLNGNGDFATPPYPTGIAETAVTFSDNTTNNVSTSKHGYTPKLSNVATEFLRGDGTWAAPTSAASYGRPYKFLIRKEGSYYKVYDSDGALLNSDTSFSDMINGEAFNGLTGSRTMPELIFVDGEVTVDDTVLVPSLVHVVANGSWTATDSLNKQIIKNDDQADHNTGIILEGMTVQGNSSNQTSATRGIEIINTNPVSVADLPYPEIQLKNLLVKDSKGHGIHIVCTAQYGLSILLQNASSLASVYGGGTERGTALYIEGVTEGHKIDGGIFDSYDAADTYSMELKSCRMGDIKPLCVNQRVHLYQCINNTYQFPYVDIGGEYHGVLFDGSQFNNVTSAFIHTLGNSVVNASMGIYLQSAGIHSSNNRFSNIYAGQGYDSGTKHFDYVIKEADSNQNNNQYVNVNGEDCELGALYLMGAESKNQHTNIIGTVTEA